MTVINKNYFQLWLLLVLFLTGCAQDSVDMSRGAYKVGKPYVVNGKRYYPEVNYEYSETGLASWYGPGFNGKRTANGERFNENELTAAHRTLPMPSIVKVTNLENGKSVVVRINDRGPFSKSRIIDVSKRTAELLGFKNKGVAKVKVTILEKESRRIASAAMDGQDTTRMGIPADGPTHASYQTASLGADTGELSLQTSAQTVVPGHLTNGNFYPDLIVSQEAVKPTNLYVQVGAFSLKENAIHLMESVAPYGQAQIKSITTNGRQYFRVRIPVSNAEEADTLMSKIVRAGNKNALVVVE